MQRTDKQKVLFLAKQEPLEQSLEGTAAEAFVTAFIKNFEKGKIEITKKMLADRVINRTNSCGNRFIRSGASQFNLIPEAIYFSFLENKNTYLKSQKPLNQT